MGHLTIIIPTSNMKKFIVLFCAHLCLASPLPQTLGFGDATPEEIAEIRAGTFGEMFDENPQYTFDFKVSDDVEQTYIAQQETRDSDIVRGSYSYVDPLGSLITVNYEAGPMGYTETRNVQENFVQIKERPASSFSSSNSGSSSVSSSAGISSNSGSFSSGSSSNFGSSSFSDSSNFGANSVSDSSSSFGSNSFSGSSSLSAGQQSSSFSQDDLISTVVEQIQPLVSGAVSSAIGASQSGRTVARVRVPVSAVRVPAPATAVVAP